ncbi:hypothetical protein B0H11DRAFT_1935157 [Mycena galericulata]|nr:hypothetical protein B0H11DRAFT_1935157 [Mycena galericulata]
MTIEIPLVNPATEIPQPPCPASRGFGCEVPNKGTFVDAEVVRRVRHVIESANPSKGLVRGRLRRRRNFGDELLGIFVPTATGGVSAREGVRSSRASYMSASLDDLSCKGGSSMLAHGRFVKGYGGYGVFVRRRGSSQRSRSVQIGGVVSVGTKSIKGSGVPSFAVEAL